ncbi:hypothetical protein C8Q79DRAFT_930566 [Trametes meyenii]|nr:hypothetical protein C8Q79DRAFT_930566 [Trametes meyenii]
MKFSTTLAVLGAAAAANAASLLPRQATQCAGGQKTLAGYERPFVGGLVRKCVDDYNASDKANPWALRNCVAAAVAATPGVLRDVLSCTNPDISSETAFPSLDYNVYATIVGDCAWQEGGCPITRQNFLDLLYSSIGTESDPIWPDNVDDVKKYYIGNLLKWTNTGDSAPYTNFNDYLHFGGVLPGHCVPSLPNGC